MPLTCIGELSLAGNSSRNHIGMARNSSRNRRSNRSNGNDATEFFGLAPLIWTPGSVSILQIEV